MKNKKAHSKHPADGIETDRIRNKIGKDHQNNPDPQDLEVRLFFSVNKGRETDTGKNDLTEKVDGGQGFILYLLKGTGQSMKDRPAL